MQPYADIQVDLEVTEEKSREKIWRILLPLNVAQVHVLKESEEATLMKKTDTQWEKIFEESVFFQGFDRLLWGQFLACVYSDPETHVFGCIVLDKLGITHFSKVNLSEKSPYYPAILNLSDEFKNSNVRRVLACSLLEKFARMDTKLVERISMNKELEFDYDQTHAGDLANSCKLVEFCTPGELGKSVLLHGLIRPKFISSLLMDVVYENKPEVIDANNELVFYLGEQLEQLFDPLSEYSPEQTEHVYKPPEYPPESQEEKDIPLLDSICDELLNLQTNFTLSIVDFLQKFLIPLRIEVLNGEIPGLSTVKLNRLFPPTIDEVTRINCIFLDALKSATSYGSLEVLRACSLTIPYFYKAYSRHEAATKNFSKDIKLFLQKFSSVIPNSRIYTEMKIETIIKGPQEKLMKIKLILERLWAKKSWSSLAIQTEAAKCFNNTMEVIDTFGRLDSKQMSAYNTRVFTPSGKILTELAKGWPLELQYKWLKRRIVGVFDVISADNTKQRDLLVLFSDYIVLLNILDSKSYYEEDNNKPLISDVLMNSLINEVPLPPKIPKLQVISHCYIDKVMVASSDKNSIELTFLDTEKPRRYVYNLASSKTKSFHIDELITKAKILEKNSAFHLFRANQNNFNLYFTAHELEAYENETIRSPCALFLNCEPTISVLKQNKLGLAFFAKLNAGKSLEEVVLTSINANGHRNEEIIPLSLLMSIITERLIKEYSNTLFSSFSPFWKQILVANEEFVTMLGKNFNTKDSKNSEDIIHDLSETESHDFKKSHKKDKSYGTITTFRSSVSDLKDDLYESTKINDTEVRSPAKSSRERSINKTKSHTGFLTKILGILKRRTKKTLPNSPKTKLNFTPEKDKRMSIRSRKSKRLPEISAPTIEERAVSVIHNNNLAQFNKALSNSSLPKIITELNQGENLSRKNSFIISDNPPHNISSDKEIREEGVERQSQIFNDDLFGDLLEVSSNRMITPVVLPNSVKSNASSSIECLKDDFPPEESSNSYSDLLNQGQTKIIHESKSQSIIGANPIDNSNNMSTSNVEKIKQKPPVFPTIPKYAARAVELSHSPSFIELYKEMRLVLDETDEFSNWRRLSSEVSLNEKYAINKKKDTDSSKLSHVLENDITDDINKLQNITEHQDSDIKRNTEQDLKTSKGSSDPTSLIFSRGSTFSFLSSSPVKMIKPESYAQTRSENSESSTGKFLNSSRRELSHKHSGRLVELTFHSNEDLNESTSLKSNDISGDLSIDISHTISPEPKLKDTTVELDNNKNEENEVEKPILDYLDFSSFHMSFNSTDNEPTQETSQVISERLHSKLQDNKDNLQPIVYQLKNIRKSNDTFYSSNDLEEYLNDGPDEDPIWVSPSKLDAFDLTKMSETVFQSVNPNSENSQRHSYLLTQLSKSSDRNIESSLLKDSSFGYLGTLVSEHDPDDPPTRLTFRA